MRNVPIFVCITLTGFSLAGCATTPHSPRTLTRSADREIEKSTVVQAARLPGDADNTADLANAPEPDEKTKPNPGRGHQSLGLSDLVDLALERNPRLAQVSWAVEAARGRAIQAGLCPNPVFSTTGNEISDRTGPGGIWSVSVGQEIVTGSKLGLSQAAASKEMDQATLNVVAERYRLITEIRQGFFEAVTLQRRVDLLADLVKLADQSVANAKKLLEAKETAELDLVQLEVDLERYRADLEAAQRALPGAYRRLAASVGVQDLPIHRLRGDLDAPVPEYDLDRLRTYVLSIHPEVRSAEFGVERAQLVLLRAEAEPIPNLTVSAGYTYQGQNRSHDWDVGISVPIPIWNKNQGNILAARAQLNEAVSQVGKVQNDLVERLATSFRSYAAARQRAERYKATILPKAQRTYELSLKAYQGGQFEYLRVLAAQRALFEARLEFVRSLGEMWQAASEIAGLMLEDHWPPAPPALLPERDNR